MVQPDIRRTLSMDLQESFKSQKGKHSVDNLVPYTCLASCTYLIHTFRLPSLS